jgi:hypothetical protein
LPIENSESIASRAIYKWGRTNESSDGCMADTLPDRLAGDRACRAIEPAAAATVPEAVSAWETSPVWQSPKADEVKAQVFAWLDAKHADPALHAKVEAIWSDLSNRVGDDDFLARVAATFAACDSRAARLVDLCSQSRRQTRLPDVEWLRDPGIASWMSNNLRLYYARWLIHELLFDEAAEQLAGLEPNDVVAPASLLFYQSVVYHATLSKDSGLKSIEELLQGAELSPKRYVAVARLMQDDLANLEEESLDHIARRMGDIQRRLDLGRAGPKVRQVEDGVVESLDKLIKKIEDQQKQQTAEGGDAIQSSSPAQDSYLKGGKGPGDVTKKNIGSSNGWGDLPPKEREEAMQQIGRDFPSHYRDVIEQYFRRLASEGNE